MKKKICFITGTRADYGIMAPIIREIAKTPEVELQVIATNMHLSPRFGMTVNEIEKDGVGVNARIECVEDDDSPASAVRSMAKVEEGMAEVLPALNPDIVVILGDRYEALAAACAVSTFGIPIAHLHGGETTEGALDNRYRHAITQLSSYHFASTSQYADKIKSMGADPEKVFHSGAPGAEVKEEENPETAGKFYEKTGLQPGEPFILLAMHPATLAADYGKKEVEATLGALDEYLKRGYKVLSTRPNSDPGNLWLREALDIWGCSHPRQVIMVDSLGSELFHHAMDTASAMIGNSSAALIEAPSHRLPAVNVGIRQRGRAHGITVIDTPADIQRIKSALDAALSLEMKSVVMGLPVSSLNPYYKENAAAFIANTLIKI